MRGSKKPQGAAQEGLKRRPKRARTWPPSGVYGLEVVATCVDSREISDC